MDAFGCALLVLGSGLVPCFCGPVIDTSAGDAVPMSHPPCAMSFAFLAIRDRLPAFCLWRAGQPRQNRTGKPKADGVADQLVCRLLLYCGAVCRGLPLKRAAARRGVERLAVALGRCPIRCRCRCYCTALTFYGAVGYAARSRLGIRDDLDLGP